MCRPHVRSGLFRLSLILKHLDRRRSSIEDDLSLERSPSRGTTSGRGCLGGRGPATSVRPHRREWLTPPGAALDETFTPGSGRTTLISL